MKLAAIIKRLMQPTSMAGLSVVALLITLFSALTGRDELAMAIQAAVEAGSKIIVDASDYGPMTWISAALASITAFFAIWKDDGSDKDKEPPA